MTYSSTLPTSTHFVAHLKIEAVTKFDPPRSITGVGQDPKRGIDEVTNLVIKAKSLEDLFFKMHKHIEVMADTAGDFTHDDDEES